MKEIILAIQAIIKANIPEFRMIEIDLGQLDETEPPLSYPCLLVGFDATIDYNYLSQNIQQGDMPISIKIAFKVFEKTHSVNSPSLQAQALQHYDIVKKTNQYLNTVQGEEFTTLKRINQRQIKRRDLRVFEFLYKTTITEDLTLQGQQYTPWAQIPNNTNPLPQLTLSTDIQPAPNNLNQNTIPFNTQQNYTAILPTPETITLDGQLIEV